MTRAHKPARTVDPDATFAALRPSTLEDLSRDGHLRLRGTDLARAMTQAPPRRPGRPRPHGLAQLAAITASALAVGAIAVVTAMHHSARPDEPSFSLATGAAPPQTGAGWTVTLSLEDKITQVPEGPYTMPGKALKDLRYRKLPYTAFMSYTAQETRTFADPHGLSVTGYRDDRGKGDRLTFPSREDEAAWRAAGSPHLTVASFGREAPDGDQLHVRATASELAALPTDTAGLETELRRSYEAARKRDPQHAPAVGSFTQALWDSARRLLVCPVSPGTKAALFRVLAAQPGVRRLGRVTDPLGRPGAALEMPATGRLSLLYGRRITSSRLIVDARTAQFLAYEVRDATSTPVHTESWKSAGWNR